MKIQKKLFPVQFQWPSSLHVDLLTFLSKMMEAETWKKLLEGGNKATEGKQTQNRIAQ
jgi:hypothetical protein